MNQTLNLQLEPVISSTKIIQEEYPVLENVKDTCQLVKTILKILKLQTLLQLMLKNPAAFQREHFSEESGSHSVGHQEVLPTLLMRRIQKNPLFNYNLPTVSLRKKGERQIVMHTQMKL